MSEKKELNQEEFKKEINEDNLENVSGGLDNDKIIFITGGEKNQDPYYYVIEYTDNAGYNSNYHDGPFETLEIAQAKLEEKKKEIVERGFFIKDTHIICPHIQ